MCDLLLQLLPILLFFDVANYIKKVFKVHVYCVFPCCTKTSPGFYQNKWKRISMNEWKNRHYNSYQTVKYLHKHVSVFLYVYICLPHCCLYSLFFIYTFRFFFFFAFIDLYCGFFFQIGLGWLPWFVSPVPVCIKSSQVTAVFYHEEAFSRNIDLHLLK